jgi:hypothetical protein
MAHPRTITDALEEGSAKARELAQQKIDFLREVIGMD